MYVRDMISLRLWYVLSSVYHTLIYEFDCVVTVIGTWTTSIFTSIRDLLLKRRRNPVLQEGIYSKKTNATVATGLLVTMYGSMYTSWISYLHQPPGL